MNSLEKAFRGQTNTKREGRFLVGLSVTLLLAATAGRLAGQAVAIDETRTLRPDAFVELAVVTHSLTIEGWDRNEIQITGEYDSDFESVEIEGGEQSFEFRIEQDRNSEGNRDASSEILVRLPHGARIEAQTVSGSLRAGGLSGGFSGRAVSGSVEVEGDFEDAELESVSGSVTYQGNASSVSLESVSGSVDYRGEAESVELTSVSGSVRFEGTANVVEAESVSGRVELSSETPVRSLEAQSVSGRVSYAGGLASGGVIEVESHSGGVDLLLPNVDARFELSTFSGGITTRLPGIRNEVRREGRITPNQSVSFVTGEGSGHVTASSFSGSIEIRSGG